MTKWVRAEIMILRQCAGTMTVNNIGRLIGRTGGSGTHKSARAGYQTVFAG